MRHPTEILLTDDEILEAVAMEDVLEDALAEAETALAAAEVAKRDAEGVRAAAAARVESYRSRLAAVRACDRLVEGVALQVEESESCDGRWWCTVRAVSGLSRRSAQAYEAANAAGPRNVNVRGVLIEPGRGSRDSVISWHLSREEAVELACQFVASERELW